VWQRAANAAYGTQVTQPQCDATGSIHLCSGCQQPLAGPGAYSPAAVIRALVDAGDMPTDVVDRVAAELLARAVHTCTWNGLSELDASRLLRGHWGGPANCTTDKPTTHVTNVTQLVRVRRILVESGTARPLQVCTRKQRWSLEVGLNSAGAHAGSAAECMPLRA
jgi:hypothetical protein